MSDSHQDGEPKSKQDSDPIVGCFVWLLVLVIGFLGVIGLFTDFFLAQNRSNDSWLLDGLTLDRLSAKLFAIAFILTAAFLMLERMRWFKSLRNYKKVSKSFVWLLAGLVVILILLSLVRHR